MAKPAAKTRPGAAAAPRKALAPRKPAARGKLPAALPAGWAARLRGRGPSWLGVAMIVLSLLVILPIAAAVLGDIWAVILAALVGGFALGRATAR